MRHLLLAALLLLVTVPVVASTNLTFLDETFLPSGAGTSAPDATTTPRPPVAAGGSQDELAATLQSLNTMLGSMMAQLQRQDELITNLMTLLLRALPGAMSAAAPCLPGMACPPSSQAPLSAAALTPGCGSMASVCQSLSRGCSSAPTSSCSRSSSCPRTSSSCSSSGRPSCIAAAPRVVRSCGR